MQILIPIIIAVIVYGVFHLVLYLIWNGEEYPLMFIKFRWIIAILIGASTFILQSLSGLVDPSNKITGFIILALINLIAHELKPEEQVKESDEEGRDSD